MVEKVAPWNLTIASDLRLLARPVPLSKPSARRRVSMNAPPTPSSWPPTKPSTISSVTPTKTALKRSFKFNAFSEPTTSKSVC